MSARGDVLEHCGSWRLGDRTGSGGTNNARKRGREEKLTCSDIMLEDHPEEAKGPLML
jgi:hypothetical protein